MNRYFKSLMILAGLQLVILVSCHKPVTIIEKLEGLNIDEYFDIEFSAKSENSLLSDWETYYFDTNDCKCIFGQEYFVFVKDNGGKNKNLVFALQGGGACIPGWEGMCKEEATDEDVYNAEYHYHYEGSPVQDWNSIFVPYCDGSVHSGDNAADYDDDGTIDYWHWGLHSTSAAVSLAKQLYPDVEKIYLTGCSAGGYGTFTAMMLIRLKYPDAMIYVMNESGPGLNNPEDPETWDILKSTWNIDHLLPDGCERCDGQLIFLYDWMLQFDKNLKIGLYNSYQDEVIAEEFLEMKPGDYEDLLLETSGYINEAYPDKFKRFIIKGNSHCVGDYKYEIDGTNLVEWIDQLITDDPEWEDLLE